APRRHRPRHAADLRAAVAEDSAGAASGEIKLEPVTRLHAARIIELPVAYLILRDHESNATFRSHAREATGRKHKMSGGTAARIESLQSSRRTLQCRATGAFLHRRRRLS